MTKPKHDLDSLQCWLQSVIMHPGGVVPGIRQAESRQHIDVDVAEIESVILPSQAVSSVERLEIYARAYYARLLECLQAEFPVTLQALGEELFNDFAFAYLQAYPSRSYTLDHLGRDFARYLAESRAAADATGEAADAWLDFLADLACLEWNIAEVFDGPGVEEQRLLDIDQIRAVPVELWPAARLVPVPCLRLLKLSFPVDQYYRELRDGTEPAPPERAETWVAITRRNFVVRHYPLTAAQHAILSAFIAGEPVGTAILCGAELLSENELDSFAADLQDWFRRWAAEGFFLEVRAE